MDGSLTELEQFILFQLRRMSKNLEQFFFKYLNKCVLNIFIEYNLVQYILIYHIHSFSQNSCGETHYRILFSPKRENESDLTLFYFLVWIKTIIIALTVRRCPTPPR